MRGGKRIKLKEIADKALDALPAGQVRNVLVHNRTNAETRMVAQRDLVLTDEMMKHRPVCPPVEMDAEDPLFLLYTSGRKQLLLLSFYSRVVAGSTGNPKGMEHTTGGYLTYASLTHKEVCVCTAPMLFS